MELPGIGAQEITGVVDKSEMEYIANTHQKTTMNNELIKISATLQERSRKELPTQALPKRLPLNRNQRS